MSTPALMFFEAGATVATIAVALASYLSAIASALCLVSSRSKLQDRTAE